MQLAGRSQTPAASRHWVVEDLKPSTQLPAPSQESVASQRPPLELPVQAVVADAKGLAGQVVDVPVQLEAR